METKVLRIDVDLVSHDKVTADVSFYQQDKDGLGYSARLVIWIPKRDVPLSELRRDALRAAGGFLKDAIVSVSS